MSNRPLAIPTPDDWNGVRDKIVEWRCMGKSVDFICTVMNLKKHVVERILKQEFQSRLGVRQQLIEKTALELSYVKDKLVNAYLERGDRRDAEVALKYQDRICKLFGMDAPTKVEMKIEDWTEEQVYEELKRAGIQTSIQPKEEIEDAVVEDLEPPENYPDPTLSSDQ